MKHRYLILMLLLPFIAVEAAEIELVDKATGEVVGTIDSEADSEVTIKGTTYVARIRASATERVARSIRIPNFHVENTPLFFVLEFLTQRNREVAPTQLLNVAILDPKLRNKEVTLKLPDSSYHTILTSIAELLDCELAFEDERIAFRKKGDATPE